MRNLTCPLIAVLLLAGAGCGGPAPVDHGTSGIIQSGSAMLSDVQITVHRVDGDARELIGFGVSKPGGTFGLMQAAAAGPLWLKPGQYAFTLESVGPEPLVWASEYSQPDKTPLTRAWTDSDESLVLDVPEPQAWQRPRR